MKSANKRWKESGTTLSFKEWIERENSKEHLPQAEISSFIPFNGGDSAASAINDTIKAAQQDIKQSSGYVDAASKDTVFGLDKRILIFSGILVASSLGFYFYTKMKKK